MYLTPLCLKPDVKTLIDWHCVRAIKKQTRENAAEGEKVRHSVTELYCNNDPQKGNKQVDVPKKIQGHPYILAR